MKKIFSVVISVALLLSMAVTSYAENILVKHEYKNSNIEETFNFAPDDEVTFIVEVSGDAVLAGERAAMLGVDYLTTDEAKTEEELLILAQEEVISSIEEETDNAQVESTYTALFNGFSIKAAYSDLETIKNIPGVKNVYISEELVVEPYLSTSVGLTGSLPEQTSGYTGSGQAVAIIDSEFDTNHEIFSAAIDNEKFSQEDISTILSGKTLNASGTIGRIYINEKIPFAYDYYDKDTDVYSSSYVHGTHVAGIVGGKNGKKSDGTLFSGVAPEAQLILMKVGDEEGKMNTDAIMSALEDAAKIGVCAVNLSFGSPYISPQAVDLITRCYDAAYNAGILLSAAAGNSSLGYLEKTPLTKNIDYSSSGVPDGVSSSFSVASANNSASGIIRSVSSFSSYGVNDSLELKPEITAIGGSVYSSVPDNGYDTKSGTSMAAPHITGVAALMNEHIDKTNPSVTGKERVDLIQNLLMSTATPIINQSTGVPYSPRVQGAGIVNTEKATKTPVILIGDSGKTKLSLKDGLTDTLNLKFIAKNLTNDTVTFDDISVSVLTDGYTQSSTDGEYYVGESKSLTINELTAPEKVTISGNGSAEISVTIKLDSEELLENAEIFENGFFIDGFVKLKNSEGTIPDAGLPFTGFYGDWTKAPVFDSTVYDEGGSTLLDDEENGGTYLLTPIGDYFYRTGYIAGTGEPNKNYIAVSPNGNGWGDSLYFSTVFMRTITDFSYTITNSSGKTVCKSETDTGVVNKFYQASCTIYGTDDLDDGDYTITFSAKHNYEKENATEHKMSLPFYVDTKAPVIKNVVLNEAQLSVTVYENKYMEYIYIAYPTTSGKTAEAMFTYPDHNKNATYGVRFNLTDLDTQKADDIVIEVVDNAKNYYANTYSCLKGKIVPKMTSFDYLSGMLSTGFNITNKAEKIESCNVLLAFYDENGKLVHTEIKENIAINTGNDTLTFNMFADLLGAKLCKMFIWEPEKSIAPLDTYKTFNISSLLE